MPSGQHEKDHCGADYVARVQPDECRLIDELRIVVQPIVLGRGKALFKDVKERHALTLLDVKPLQSGMVRLTYRIGSST